MTHPDARTLAPAAHESVCILIARNVPVTDVVTFCPSLMAPPKSNAVWLVSPPDVWSTAVGTFQVKVFESVCGGDD